MCLSHQITEKLGLRFGTVFEDVTGTQYFGSWAMCLLHPITEKLGLMVDTVFKDVTGTHNGRPQ
jgi:hypothetical protein